MDVPSRIGLAGPLGVDLVQERDLSLAPGERRCRVGGFLLGWRTPAARTSFLPNERLGRKNEGDCDAEADERHLSHA